VRLAQAIYLWLYVRNTNEKKKELGKGGSDYIKDAQQMGINNRTWVLT
jgi:hypothetical protein